MKADVTIQTPSRHYPVFVRNDWPRDILGQLIRDLNTTSLFIVIDENVEEYHGKRIVESLNNPGLQIHKYVLTAGETSKSEHYWSEIVDFLLRQGARRNMPLLAIGGGVTGDVAGFAASTALRGLPLIHIPTTLLAMVDSSIGGKTGINHKMGKNLIGTFYQPDAVLVDTTFLSTLEERDWSNGLSEILKYGAIHDPDIFDECESIFLNTSNGRDHTRITSLILRSINIKADIVSRDETESGIRAWLNFGHTFAHALEKTAGYGTVSHGEAVFIGMIAATRLSAGLGAEIEPIRFKRFSPLYNFNRDLRKIPVDQLIANMHADKKKISDVLRLVLLRHWGEPYVRELADSDKIRDAWTFSFSQIFDDN